MGRHGKGAVKRKYLRFDFADEVTDEQQTNCGKQSTHPLIKMATPIHQTVAIDAQRLPEPQRSIISQIRKPLREK